jgi:hypothetical protein
MQINYPRLIVIEVRSNPREAEQFAMLTLKPMIASYLAMTLGEILMV